MMLDTSKLVQAPALLEALFDEPSRPTVRWVRRMTAKRVIPYYKIGHCIFFDVPKVRAALERRNLVNPV